MAGSTSSGLMAGAVSYFYLDKPVSLCRTKYLETRLKSVR